jgi:N-acetylglucosamine-6-phosphate deacetylase
MHHRLPGLAGAVLENDAITCELICDGVHLAPTTVRLAFKLLGEHRAVVVSDSVAPAGFPDGRYTINGQTLWRLNDAVYLPDGQTLAGSATNVFSEFRNLLRWGIPLESALRACSINPARVIGKANEIGSIAPGKRADMLLVNWNWDLDSVCIGGKKFEVASGFH